MWYRGLKIILQIFSVYFVIVGTWNLANATVGTQTIAGIDDIGKKEKNRKPWSYLFPLRKINSLSSDFGRAYVLGKQFRWSLVWLISGIILQFISQLLPTDIS